MNRKKLKLGLLLFGLGLAAQAQQATISSGGDASGTGGTVAYSVGQIAYTTNSSSSGTIEQGVQQPYEIFNVGVKKTELDISLSVFPNPTSNCLILKVQNYNNEKIVYQLLDMPGKLIESDVITSGETKINLNNLPAATYFVNVTGNKTIQSFKIIKN